MNNKWNIIVTILSILIVLLIMAGVALAIHASLGLLELPYRTAALPAAVLRL